MKYIKLSNGDVYSVANLATSEDIIDLFVERDIAPTTTWEYTDQTSQEIL